MMDETRSSSVASIAAMKAAKTFAITACSAVVSKSPSDATISTATAI